MNRDCESSHTLLIIVNIAGPIVVYFSLLFARNSHLHRRLYKLIIPRGFRASVDVDAFVQCHVRYRYTERFSVSFFSSINAANVYTLRSKVLIFFQGTAQAS